MGRSSQTATSTKSVRTPRLYVADCQHTQGEVVVSERNHHYLARVLRAQVGQSLVVFNGQGLTAEATISAISKKQTQITITGGQHTPDVRLPITLGLAWIKADRFDWALQKATELGVSAIQPMITPFQTALPKANDFRKKRRTGQKFSSMRVNNPETIGFLNSDPCARSIKSRLQSQPMSHIPEAPRLQHSSPVTSNY